MNIARFFSKVKKTETCWNWLGKLSAKGYGKAYTCWYTHNEQLAHRTSYIIHFGKIPRGAHILHKCDNPKCVNPEHLYAGTNSDNVRDKMNRGRSGGEKRSGKLNVKSKFTEDEVYYIRNSIESYNTLAHAYGVTPQAIYAIKKRKNWKHLK